MNLANISAKCSDYHRYDTAEVKYAVTGYLNGDHNSPQLKSLGVKIDIINSYQVRPTYLGRTRSNDVNGFIFTPSNIKLRLNLLEFYLPWFFYTPFNFQNIITSDINAGRS